MSAGSTTGRPLPVVRRAPQSRAFSGPVPRKVDGATFFVPGEQVSCECIDFHGSNGSALEEQCRGGEARVIDQMQGNSRQHARATLAHVTEHQRRHGDSECPDGRLCGEVQRHEDRGRRPVRARNAADSVRPSSLQQEALESAAKRELLERRAAPRETTAGAAAVKVTRMCPLTDRPSVSQTGNAARTAIKNCGSRNQVHQPDDGRVAPKAATQGAEPSG